MYIFFQVCIVTYFQLFYERTEINKAESPDIKVIGLFYF